MVSTCGRGWTFGCYRDEVPLNPKIELTLIDSKFKLTRITLDMTERRNQS